MARGRLLTRRYWDCPRTWPNGRPGIAALSSAEGAVRDSSVTVPVPRHGRQGQVWSGGGLARPLLDREDLRRRVRRRRRAWWSCARPASSSCAHGRRRRVHDRRRGRLHDRRRRRLDDRRGRRLHDRRASSSPTGTGFGVSVITTEWPPCASATAAWVKAPADAPSATTTRPGCLVDLTATPLPDCVPPTVLIPPCQSSTDVLPPEMAVLLTIRPDSEGRRPRSEP